MVTIEVNGDQRCVIITTDDGDGCAQASLLTAGGEEAEQFSLQQGYNRLSFIHHPSGTYSLRIDCEKEVVVRQVILGPAANY